MRNRSNHGHETLPHEESDAKNMITALVINKTYLSFALSEQKRKSRSKNLQNLCPLPLPHLPGHGDLIYKLNVSMHGRERERESE